MKSIFLLIALWAHSIGAPTGPIVYQFPGKVQSCIKTWVNSFDEAERKDLFFYLGSSRSKTKGEDTFYLHFCTGRGSGEWGKMVDRSNRWVRIDSSFYPILVDYDEQFGISYAQDLSQLGTLGKRNGLIRRSKTLFHGNTVFFDLKGKHIKSIPRLKNRIFSSDKSSKNKVLISLPKDASPIVYIIPDKEELAMAAITDDYNLVIIHHSDDGVTIEPVFGYNYLYYKNYSHRFVLVGKKALPLVFDYDLLFSIGDEMSQGDKTQTAM